MSIFEQCQKICSDILGVDSEQCTEDATFVDDLGADSLDVVEITMRIEEDFDFEVSERETESLNTFGDLVALVERKTA